MDIQLAAHDWLSGMTLRDCGRKYGVNKDAIRERLMDHFGAEVYHQHVRRKVAARLPPKRKPRNRDLDVAAAARDWLGGMTLDDVRKRHGVGNPAAMGRLIRKHLGDAAYDRECCARRSASGKAAWEQKRDSALVSIHRVFTAAWGRQEVA